MSARKLSILLALSISGCGGGGNDTPDAKPDAIDYSIGDAPQLKQACTDAVGDVYTLPSGLPAMDDSHRGDVIRCAVTEKLTVPEIKTQIAAYNANNFNTSYMNTSEGVINSGFWTYRITYRTTRNTVNNARAEGETAAWLIVPAKPKEGGPLVVFGHGSSGFAPKCAPSKLDLSGPVQDQDYPPMLYRLAGYGYTVVAPDYTGFMAGQTPGYFNAEDEAHAILDATRAAEKVLPTAPSKVVFVGHSQGAHAVLAAHSYAKAYGMSGDLVGVATLAPFWISMSLWAAATSPAAGLQTATDVNSILYAMTYAYSAAQLREGNGETVFQTAKAAAAVEVVNGAECYDATKMQALGATPDQFFETNYVNVVGGACAISFTPDCTSALAAKWKSWWLEDRPAIDAMGPPILALFGGADTFVTKTRAACAKKKMTADLAAVSGATTQVTYCINAKAAHRDIIRSTDVDYVNEWIAAKAGIGSEPAACTPFPASELCGGPPNDY